MDYFFFTDPTRSVAPTFFRPPEPVQYLPLVPGYTGLADPDWFPPPRLPLPIAATLLCLPSPLAQEKARY